MENNGLSLVQNAIYEALKELKDKKLITEANLLKKIREKSKIGTKNKAFLAYADVEKSTAYLCQQDKIFFSIHSNSVNDLLLKQDENYAPLEAEAVKRRRSSEKSRELLTERDFKNPSKAKPNNKKMSRKNIAEWDD